MTTIEKYRAASAEYLARLARRNIQPATMRNYKSVLDGFGAYLSRLGETDLYDAVEAWKESLLAAGKTPSTVRQYLTTLGIFFDRAARRSFPEALRYAENPVDADSFPKVPTRPYAEILTDEQAALLYRNQAPSPQFKPLWPRNYAMLMLFLNEKIRNAELLDLRLCDVDFQYHELRIQSGKGRKYRVVDLSDLTEAALTLYLNSGLRPSALPPEDYLFGTTAAHERGRGRTDGAEPWHRGTGPWASSIVERTVRAATGVPSVRSHDLRHVGARICLNAGASLEELQGELGHAQLSTTTLYSGRLMQRRRRESAQAVLAARSAAAKQLTIDS